MRPFSVYVASAFANRALVASYCDRLELAGVHITHNWTKAEPPQGSELALPINDQRRFASDDLAGALECDLLWLLSPELGGCGCFIEFGAALAVGKPVVVSGPARTIFTSLADAHYSTHELGCAAVLRRADRHAALWRVMPEDDASTPILNASEPFVCPGCGGEITWSERSCACAERPSGGVRVEEGS